MSDSLADHVDEHDLDAVDVIEALDVDPTAFDVDPSDFYDGIPTIDELAEDFLRVRKLKRQKEELESELAELRGDGEFADSQDRDSEGRYYLNEHTRQQTRK